MIAKLKISPLNVKLLFLLSVALLRLNGLFASEAGDSFIDLNIPRSHIPFFFANSPQERLYCERSEGCPYKDLVSLKRCWGYEKSCDLSIRLSNPKCPEDSRRWAQDKKSQIDGFWKAADFGLVLDMREKMKTFCKPKTETDSFLECTPNLRYCRAKNIYLDFRTANIVNNTERQRYREDVVGEGQVGGHCELDVDALKSENKHKSPLQSWFAELGHYTALDFEPSDGIQCDIIFEKPTYLIKLDAGVNMYHHFCDFVNLYVSQHINNSFSLENNIIMWDTSILPYGDFFSLTWNAFTKNPIIPLKDLDGKRVCIKDAVFPLLARAIYGLFYNMPLMPGCYGSSLIKAFSEHVLHRLQVPQTGPLEHKIRVTLIARNTKYRNIMNQNELVAALKTDGEFEVTVAEFERNMVFTDQLKISHNSDILIGMHGAGLTHMLFQPDWGVIIELYNCEDEGCYYDLSRLRGIKYMTWEKSSKFTQEDEGHHPTLGAHAKFTNYAFDVEEFMRLIYLAADHVRSHPTFVESRQRRKDTERTADNRDNQKVEL